VSAGQIFELVIIVAVAALFAVAVPKVWRGTSELNFEQPSLPALAVSPLLVFIGGFASGAAGEDSSSYDVWMSIGVLGLLCMLFLVVPIVWLNRPRFLVPPPQRDDPGALAEWRAVRARR
jgi:hypothetical protein